MCIQCRTNIGAKDICIHCKAAMFWFWLIWLVMSMKQPNSFFSFLGQNRGGGNFSTFLRSGEAVLSDKLAHSQRAGLSCPRPSALIQTQQTSAFWSEARGLLLHHYNLPLIYNPDMSDGSVRAWTNSKSPDLWIYPSHTAQSSGRHFLKQFSYPSLIKIAHLLEGRQDNG